MSVIRPRLPYRPNWSPELAGYVHNSIRRYWSTLAPWYQWEDLAQESQIVFLLCRRRYTGVVDNPAWFMALFKTAWQNRLVDLTVAIPRYSLLEGLDHSVLQQAAPDTLHELLELIEALPLGLRMVLSDICRPKGRLRISQRTLLNLRAALSGVNT